MGTKTLRVALYARISTTDQDCSQQLHDLREYASARGWTVQGEYVDNGHSLWTAETADNSYEFATDTFVVRNGK